MFLSSSPSPVVRLSCQRRAICITCIQIHTSLFFFSLSLSLSAYMNHNYPSIHPSLYISICLYLIISSASTVMLRCVATEGKHPRVPLQRLAGLSPRHTTW